MSGGELRSLPLNGGRRPAAEPLLSFVVLLNNGETITQAATSWSEHTDEDGAGIAYNFYVQRTRVMSLEYSEVRAVFCKEHCDVEQAVQSLRKRKRGRTKSGAGK